MDAGPIEVRVTPHSSLSSWDGRGARQTKAKADGGGDKMKKRAREREREAVSCLQTREVILRRETSHKEVEKRGKRNGHEIRTKEFYKMFLLYRPEIGCSEEEKRKR